MSDEAVTVDELNEILDERDSALLVKIAGVVNKVAEEVEADAAAETPGPVFETKDLG